jgi:hypothetical protein
LHASCAYAGDINAIKVGDKTNIQDNAIIHVAKHSLDSSSSQPKPTIIGNSVTVGHGATLHACTIGDGCLVRLSTLVIISQLMSSFVRMCQDLSTFSHRDAAHQAAVTPPQHQLWVLQVASVNLPQPNTT